MMAFKCLFYETEIHIIKNSHVIIITVNMIYRDDVDAPERMPM